MTKRGKNNQPVTFELLTEFYTDFLKPQFERLHKKIEKNHSELKDEIGGVKVEVLHLKDEVKGLKADLSVVPTRREFNQLKRKVDTLQN